MSSTCRYLRELFQESSRISGMSLRIPHLYSDLRYTLRTLRKSPGFVIVAVLAVAFGIGVNSAIFTLVNAIALRPLPVKDSSNVVTVYQIVRGAQRNISRGDSSYFSYPDYTSYRDQNNVFSGLAAYAQVSLTLGGPGARHLSGDLVTCNFFEVVTVRLSLGRGFRSEECAAPGASPLIVISHRFWESQYGSDAGVLGRTAILNGQPFTIIGVAPPGFNGASIFSSDVWLPLSMRVQVLPDRFLDSPDARWLQLAGRMKPTVSLAAVRANLALTAARIDQQNPPRKTTLQVDHATLLNVPVVRTLFVSVGAVVLAAVSLVLLIACANVANLLLARAAGRQKEIAVRLALGASRGRLIGQLLTESLLLSLSGGFLGLLAAWATLRALVPVLMARIPAEAPVPVLNLNPDIRITVYLLLLSFVTGLGFGLLPALQATRVDLNTALKETGALLGGLRRRWLRTALVTAQVAVCLILLIATGLLARGLYAAQSIDPGFETKDITVANFDLTRQGYDAPRAAEFHRRLAASLAAQPGLETAFAAPVPLSGGRYGSIVTLDAKDLRIPVSWATVSANYFDALGIPIVRGRGFEERDASADSNLIISESAARRFWPGEDPIGKPLRFGRDTDQAPVYRQVIGVAKDIHSTGLAQPDDAFVYVIAKDYSRVSLLVRGPGANPAIARMIHDRARTLDPNVLVQTNPMEDNLRLFQFPSRATAILGGVLGFAGLLLASLGIYGVVSYAVTQRTREIGIRMSLGARKSDVLGMILGQALRPVAVGIAIGLMGSAAASRILQSLLFGVSPLDPLVFAAVSILLAAIAALAGYAPALRAAGVDPISALRHE
jgi:macrolide transport system ATP-binding/permease protein